MDGVGGKFSKESDSSLQICATDLVVHVIGWEGCIVGRRGGLKMFGDMWDKGFTNIGGGWCISDRVCFGEEETHSNIKH